MKYLGLLVGFVDCPVAEKDVWVLKNATEKDIQNLLASHVLQLFFVSIDGTVAFPLGFFPTKGISTEWLVLKYCQWKNLLKEHGIDIVWSSSDGAVGAGFVHQMKETYDGKYWHIYDYVHMVKNLRNEM